MKGDAAGGGSPAEPGDAGATRPHRRPRLLIGLHTLRVAGAERIALELAHHLEDEFRIRVASVFDRDLRPGSLPRGATVGGALELLFGPADVVHTHLFLPGLLARIRRVWDRRTPWIHTVHYHDYEAISLGRLKRWVDHRFVFPAVDELVAVSEDVARGLPSEVGARTILNAISLERDGVGRPPRPGPAEGPVPGHPPVFGTVAMLRPEKNLEVLIEAAAHLGTALPGARIRIAGDGPLRRGLEERIAALQLGEVVELCGYVPDVHGFYRSLDVYVQPSRNEGFGLAALEAFRFGLPVVATRAGFLPTLLGEGAFGLVLARADASPRDLADALVAAWRDREEWQGRALAGLEHWRARLSVERMVAAYREVLKSQVRVPGPLHVTVIQPVVTHATGGLQRQLLIQTRELVRRGFRVTLVQRRDVRLRRDPETRKAWEHVGLVQVPDAPWLPDRVRGVLFTAGALGRLLLRRTRTDVYHAHQLYSPTLVGAWAKSVRGGALVTKVTAAGVLGEARQLRELPFRSLRLRTFRLIDRVIVLHSAMGDEMAELGLPRERIAVIPNAVDMPPEPARIQAAPGSPLPLLWVGRLSTEKGLDVLLEACRHMADRGRSPEVHLVGGRDPDRDAEPELRRLASALPPNAQAHFHGECADVARFYRTGPVFVLPSRSEGMSNALLEAMAWGLPCVASDIPANRALVEEGVTGLLFRDGDADSLAQALERLHEDLTRGDGALARAVGQGARRRIERGFSPEVVGEALAALYQKVAC